MKVYSLLSESECPELPFLFHAKTNLSRNRKKIIYKYRDILITESRILYMIILQLIILGLKSILPRKTHANPDTPPEAGQAPGNSPYHRAVMLNAMLIEKNTDILAKYTYCIYLCEIMDKS